MSVTELLEKRRSLIDRELEKILPGQTLEPKKLHRAMRYSVFSGGKRIRPILTIESCLCCGGALKDALKAACAIEMVHTFSLIQDDLPAMDNDDYRRGKPTCHKKFDEATAILAGDALIALAFEILASGKDPSVETQLIKEFAKCIGSLGIAGGQAVDITYEGKKKSRQVLRYINLHKTAALIRASAKMGAIAARANAKDIKRIEKFGAYIGEAFQIIDDILDNGDSVRVLGKNTAMESADRLTKKAMSELSGFGASADTLKEFAGYLIERKF